MNSRHVCSSCRLRAALHSQSKTIQRQQQQWLSQAVPKAQADLGGAFAARIPDDAAARRPRTDDNRPHGRYSRLPLAPQRILDSLRDSSGELTQVDPSVRSKPMSRIRADRYQKNNGPLLVKGIDALERPPNIPLDLWDKCNLLMSVIKTTATEHPPDRKVLQLLLDIARDYQGTAGLKVLYSTQRSFHKRCYYWLKRLGETWSRDIINDNPTHASVRPLEALCAVAACRMPTNRHYPAVIWSVSTTTLESLHTAEEISGERITTLVTELMQAWNFTLRMRSLPSTDLLQSECKDWSFLPSPTTVTEILQQKQPLAGEGRFSFTQALNAFLPEVTIHHPTVQDMYSKGEALFDYPSATLVTLELLYRLKAEPNGDKITDQFEPWIKFVEGVFKSAEDTRIPYALGQKLERSGNPDMYSSIASRFKLETNGAIPSQSKTRPQNQHFERANAVPNEDPEMSVAAQDVLDRTPLAGSAEEPDSKLTFANKCSKRLGRAVEREDLNAARRVYNEVLDFTALRPKTSLPLELYENLLYSFLSLRESNLTVVIWNDLIRAGHQPTCKTYTILMRGCQNIRDLDSMESFWLRMRNAGLQPDRYAWSTRIFGLLRSGRHLRAGMKALDEIGQDWIAAAREMQQRTTAKPTKSRKKPPPEPEKQFVDVSRIFEGDVNGVPRPDVNILNSAISALAATNDALIPKVLSWGKSFGMEPDLKTYNTLINISMRRDLPEEAMSIVKTMKEKGIETNSTTWTVLLTAMFQGGMLQDMTSEQVGEHIVAFVKNIDEKVGKLDEKGYAIVIDRLLKVYNNHAAAESILFHMASRGVQPTAEIYTILMTFYLQKSPPDFASAQALWSRISGENAGYGAALDSTFFDRTIELYAPHHRIVGMSQIWKFLDTLEAQGKKLSWRAMESLARALVEAGEWDKLAKLVDKAQRERDGGPDEKHGFGQRSFWDFIASSGTMSHEKSSLLAEGMKG